MNIALGAIVITILIYPGILFRYSYLSGQYSSKNFATSLVDELVFSLVPALLLQLLAYWFTTCMLAKEIDLEIIYKLIVGPFSSSSSNSIKSLGKSDFAIIHDNVWPFTLYIIFISAIAILMGKVLRHFAKKYLWYEENPVFKFNNDWWNIFTGRILGKEIYQKQIAVNEKDEDANFFITVAALVNIGESCYLYHGKLEEYYFLNNELEKICLSSVYRRKIVDDRKSEEKNNNKDFDERYYKLPGSIFVIKYSEIINLDVQYVIVKKEKQTEPSSIES